MIFIQQVVNGLVNGSVYALIGIGITLIFGLTGIVNFAHGDFMMVAAYAALVTIGIWPGFAGFGLAVLVGIIVVSALGAFTEQVLFVRTLRRPINGFVVSLGLVLVLENLVLMRFGGEVKVIDPHVSGLLTLGSVYVPVIRAVVFAVALVLAGAFYLFLLKTRFGTALRCCNVDREVAALMGINVPRMQLLAFVLGSALAGGAGALLATSYPFTPFFGPAIIVKGFVVALAGGIGNVSGAFWTALAVGVIEAGVIGVGLSAWSEAILFGSVILLLLLRPSGLLRGSEGSAVT